jgi:hypothetical protein
MTGKPDYERLFKNGCGTVFFFIYLNSLMMMTLHYALALEPSKDLDPFVPACPCMAEEKCLSSPYGSRPRDLSIYGVLSPCPRHDHVRCCPRGCGCVAKGACKSPSKLDWMVTTTTLICPEALEPCCGGGQEESISSDAHELYHLLGQHGLRVLDGEKSRGKDNAAAAAEAAILAKLDDLGVQPVAAGLKQGPNGERVS